MPTLCGLRRRGFTPEAIRRFIELVGVSRTNSTADWGLLEHCVREDLNKTADRVMCVLNPLKVIIENYPEDKTEEFDVENNPEMPERGTRKVPFSREIYIEQDDFMIDPPSKYFRLKPDGEVRLKNAYFIKCTGYETDENGNVTLVRATYDPDSRGGEAPDGRKVKGTIHWVSAKHAIDAEVRLRMGYFCVDSKDSKPGALVFNKTVGLKDTWAKIAQKG